MPLLTTHTGNMLPPHYYTQLCESAQREFGVQLPALPAMNDRLYFLLVETESERILASGYLKNITPVTWNTESFSFHNIGGVIANEKGKGYGKKVMAAIRDYLLSHDKIGLGFCFPENQGFYEKSGFKVDQASTKRIIYRDGDSCFTAEGQVIIYLDSCNRFMKKILADGSHEIYVPDATIW